jgi:hypothetical protein
MYQKVFKVMCDISCVLEGEDEVDFEDLKDLSVTSMQDLYLVMWNVLFLNTNLYSVITNTFTMHTFI